MSYFFQEKIRREQISFNVVVNECAEAGRIRIEPRPSVDLTSRSDGISLEFSLGDVKVSDLFLILVQDLWGNPVILWIIGCGHCIFGEF